jgi:coenzyme F420-reducing hydrogenase delta subunit
MAKKMTKAQARKRLQEARSKIWRVMEDERFMFESMSNADVKKMYEICQYLGRSVAKLK